ncbi:ATP-binding protein [Micromonospora sp. NPDC004336]
MDAGELHGRKAEQDAIAELLTAARAGTSSTLVLRGEPGIGKTALLDHAVAAAGDMRLLRGTGVESEAELPFSGLQLLLRPALGHLPALPDPQRTALEAAFGLGPAAGSEPMLVGLAVLSLLAEHADETGLLCLVDDAQWLDRASREPLLFAARRLHAEGIVMIFAARDGEGCFPVPGLGTGAARLDRVGGVARVARLDRVAGGGRSAVGGRCGVVGGQLTGALGARASGRCGGGRGLPGGRRIPALVRARGAPVGRPVRARLRLRHRGNLLSRRSEVSTDVPTRRSRPPPANRTAGGGAARTTAPPGVGQRNRRRGTTGPAGAGPQDRRARDHRAVRGRTARRRRPRGRPRRGAYPWAS